MTDKLKAEPRWIQVLIASSCKCAGCRVLRAIILGEPSLENESTPSRSEDAREGAIQ